MNVAKRRRKLHRATVSVELERELTYPRQKSIGSVLRHEEIARRERITISARGIDQCGIHTWNGEKLYRCPIHST